MMIHFSFGNYRIYRYIARNYEKREKRKKTIWLFLGENQVARNDNSHDERWGKIIAKDARELAERKVSKGGITFGSLGRVFHWCLRVKYD